MTTVRLIVVSGEIVPVSFISLNFSLLFSSLQLFVIFPGPQLLAHFLYLFVFGLDPCVYHCLHECGVDFENREVVAELNQDMTHFFCVYLNTNPL